MNFSSDPFAALSSSTAFGKGRGSTVQNLDQNNGPAAPPRSLPFGSSSSAFGQSNQNAGITQSAPVFGASTSLGGQNSSFFSSSSISSSSPPFGASPVNPFQNMSKSQRPQPIPNTRFGNSQLNPQAASFVSTSASSFPAAMQHDGAMAGSSFPSGFECRVCNRIFPTNRELKLHVKTEKHYDTSASSYPSKPSTNASSAGYGEAADYTDDNNGGGMAPLPPHRYRDDRVIQCRVCKIVFATFPLLKVHMKAEGHFENNSQTGLPPPAVPQASSVTLEPFVIQSSSGDKKFSSGGFDGGDIVVTSSEESLRTKLLKSKATAISPTDDHNSLERAVAPLTAKQTSIVRSTPPVMTTSTLNPPRPAAIVQRARKSPVSSLNDVLYTLSCNVLASLFI